MDHTIHPALPVTVVIFGAAGDLTQRKLAVELSGYLARQIKVLRPEEAGAARVLSELLKNQRLGELFILLIGII